MSFKKIDQDTTVAEREIKRAQDGARNAPAPEDPTAPFAEVIRHRDAQLEIARKSSRGELPRKH